MDQVTALNAQDVEQLLECVAQRKEALLGTVCEPRKPKPYLFADRWLLASLLQKAIRRSELDVARRAGHQLLLQDPPRLWRRLMVVGLEDIGIGDPDAAGTLIGLAGLPQARAMIGTPGQALDAALKLACDAVKERSGDCFGSIASEFKLTSHSLDELPGPAKMAVLSYGHLPWRRRLRAAYLMGQDWAPAQERKAQFEQLLPIYRAAEVPETLLAACLFYRGKADDLLPLYVPLAFSLWLASDSFRTVRSLPCPAGLVGEIPNYGFDPLHNAIFGYAGWEREVVHFERSFEQRRTDEVACGYVVRVKIKVDAGGKYVVREGTGFGQARAKTPAEAHELAIKSAETDATKRALATFGNRFGLGLYGSIGAKAPQGPAHGVRATGIEHHFNLTLQAPDGAVLDGALSPEAFCTGLRQLIGVCESRADVEALATLNAASVSRIAELGLKSPRGTLYADILKRLLKKREASFVGSPSANAPANELSNANMPFLANRSAID